MNPINFKEQNCIFAEHQQPYLPLPVHKTDDGMVVSCWKLTWKERLKIIFTGKIWCALLTFNSPLQPQKLQIESPFELGKQ